MDKKKLAINCIIFGSLILSLELFMLNIISYLDRLSSKSWYSNPFDYIKETSIFIPMAIPIIMVFFGMIIYDIQNNQKA